MCCLADERHTRALELTRAASGNRKCLDFALGNDERFGIWGGLSERERRRLKKRVV